jgi:hypothetical protein
MKLFLSNNNSDNNYSAIDFLPLIFFAGRFLLYLAMMPNDIHGLGDFPNYFNVANLPGYPFFDFWTEYPPVISFYLKFLNLISKSNPYLFDFILYMTLTICGSISIWIFSRIANDLNLEKNDALIASFCYFGLLAFISYSWWYFDLIVVCIMLYILYALIHNKDNMAGFWLGIGILTKWFPLILLPSIFKFKNKKSFIKITILGIGITIIFWLFLYVLSPDLTLKSIQTQPSRSSWQTFWALIDGNMVTGAYIPLEARFDPLFTNLISGNPAVIPSWIPFLIFVGIGLFLMDRIKLLTYQNLLSFSGITWILFFLWSPGWSPQWILYLIPIILLSMPIYKGFLISFLLSLLTLIEWPILLGRQLFIGLWIIVPIRMIIFIYLLIIWIRNTKSTRENDLRIST